MAFCGYNLPGAKISEGVRENFVLQGLQAGLKGLYDCIAGFSDTGFTEGLKKIDVPLPISSALTAKLVKNSTLKIYPGFPHGMCTTEANAINRDLLAFIRA